MSLLCPRRATHPLRVARLCALAVVVMCVAACSETDAGSSSTPQRTQVRGSGSQGSPASAEQGRFALLALTAPTGRHTGVAAAPAQVEVGGQFVAWNGPSDAWALSALDLWVPEPEANGGVDACRLSLDAVLDESAVGLLTIDDSRADTHGIELVDAGTVAMARDRRSDLQVYYVPDLQAYLSGVLYGLDPGQLAYHTDAAYLFEGHGSPEVEPFNVAVTAPPVMMLTAVAGHPYDDLAELIVPQGRDLSIEWLTHASTAHDDVVYLDLYDDARSAAPLLSCVVRDDGRFDVPRAALDPIRQSVPDAALRLVARRAHAVDFALDGFDWARALFTTSDVVFLGL